MVTISGLSGTGKTTLINHLLETGLFEKIKSFTTRPKRFEEENEYFFVNKEEFDLLEKDGFFFETEENFGNKYGTPKEYFFSPKKGICYIANLDIRGALKFKKNAVFSTSFTSIYRRIK